MTINEAIKILQQDIDDPGFFTIEDVNKAEALGIEALKEMKALRFLHALDMTTRLPGETKDEKQ